MTMLAHGYDVTPPANELAEAHLNLVRKIAWHFHGRVGHRVEIDDLLQVGYLGLLDAAKRYAPQPGVTFAAYAAIRIRGAIVDYLRSASTLCRATIQTHRRIQAATQRLEHRLMRAPTEAELATELQMPADALAHARAQIGAGEIGSIDDIYSDHSLMFSDTGHSAEDQMEQDDMRRLLAGAIARLPEREALVLQLYYVEEMNVYEVAAVLGVTTGRVSQIKKAAMTRLRDDINRMQDMAA